MLSLIGAIFKTAHLIFHILLERNLLHFGLYFSSLRSSLQRRRVDIPASTCAGKKPSSVYMYRAGRVGSQLRVHETLDSVVIVLVSIRTAVGLLLPPRMRLLLVAPLRSFPLMSTEPFRQEEVRNGISESEDTK